MLYLKIQINKKMIGNNTTTTQSFDVNFGRPTVKLQLQYSNIKRRFQVHEPYQVELEKLLNKDDNKENESSNAVMTVEDQIRLR